MRVIWLTGLLPSDASHFAVLSHAVDLIAYGVASHPPHTRDWSPPLGVRTRDFDPLPHIRGGHLRWVYPGLSSALDEDAPSLIHVLSEPWGLLSWQAARWARRHPETTLAFHGCDTMWFSPGFGPVLKQTVRQRMASWCLARADGFAAETQEAIYQAELAGLTHGAARAVIHTSPRDPERFSPPTDEERSAARRSLGLPEKGVGIGFLGRLTPEKGPLLFLEALRIAVLPQTTWVAVAGGGVLESEVRAAAASIGAHFLGRLAHPTEVATFLRALDVFVIPSWRTSDWEEQSPRAVIEAMLSSCVVVGSRSGAIPEMIQDAGILVDERDPVDLARGVREAVERFRNNTDLGERGRRLAVLRYSSTAVAEQLVAFWDDALRFHARRR